MPSLTDPSSGVVAWPSSFKKLTQVQGPYASAILRFQIVFPDDYPSLPPLITVSTDIFHPLLIPLTTYTFSHGVSDASAAVSSREEDRLPPGAFCMRNAFPSWFGPAQQIQVSPMNVGNKSGRPRPRSRSPEISSVDPNEPLKEWGDVNIVQVLEYMKAAFEDPEILDNLPLECAGNQGAWHAWRAYRGLPKITSRSSSPVTGHSGVRTSLKHPGEWNWDGVFEARVKNAVEASISDATLFGSASFRPGPSSNEPVSWP